MGEGLGQESLEHLCLPVGFYVDEVTPWLRPSEELVAPSRYARRQETQTNSSFSR